jgi:hypothetical protein
LDLLKSEQARITEELEAAEQTLRDAEVEAATIERNLNRALALLPQVQEAYLEASAAIRRKYIQAFFTTTRVYEDYTIAGELAGSWDVLLDPDVGTSARQALQCRRQRSHKERGPIAAGASANEDSMSTSLNSVALVREGGLEPPRA